MYTLAFWKAAFERILASAAGGLLAVMTLDGFNLAQADWPTIAAAVGTAALVSLLKAVIAGATGNHSPSLTNAEVLPPAPGSPVGNPADRVPGPDHEAGAVDVNFLIGCVVVIILIVILLKVLGLF